MKSTPLRITYIGGPTCLLEFDGLHLITDPTFDPAGSEYKSGPATLRKLAGPAIRSEDIGPFDYVLLSHDHHFDNLDHDGRALLPHAKKVLTTQEGANRLGGNALGLQAWQSVDLAVPDGRTLHVVATPARHGSHGLDRGPVTGFVFFFDHAPENAVYVSGDTVWYEGVQEVAQRFKVQVALLHLGAARIREVSPFHITMTAREAVEAARTFANAVIVPVHFEDWVHLSEGKQEIVRTFEDANLQHILRWPERAQAVQVSGAQRGSANP